MADGHIILDTRVDTKGVNKGFSAISTASKKVLSTMTKVGVAAATAAAATVAVISKKAVEAYGDWEQLVGGVETLYKNASAKVIQYANEAYKTVGLSANEYMKNVTAFSASLLQALGNDTNAAADVSNMAMQDIADNVNKMGSSYESVQLAYQGFAKQQYMLLDNLKLGYGGTKTEMERLLQDAQKITGVKYDISNLADVYNALHVIQEQLGITGTTAKEAATTIQGSQAMMKAAYENVLTAMAGGGDLENAIDNLADSMATWLENIMPVFERALMGIGKVLERIAPQLAQTLARALIKSFPVVVNAVIQMVIGAAKGLIDGIKSLFTGDLNEAIKKTSETANKSVKSTTKSINKQTDAIEKNKEAAQGQVAAFDEVNRLSKDTTQTTGGESGGAAIPAAGISSNIEQETKKAESSFSKLANSIKEKFAPVGEYLKKTFGGAWEQIKTTGVNSWERIKQSATLVGEDFAKNIAPRIGNTFKNDILPILGDYIRQAARLFDTISGNVHKTFDTVYTDVISPFAQRFVNIWGDMWDSTKEVWDERSGPIFDGINEWLNNLQGLWETVWENGLKPIFDHFGEIIDWLWENHLKDLWHNMQEFVASVTEFLLTLWNNVIYPIYKRIAEVIGPVIADVVNTIGDVVGTVIGVISDVLGGILRALRGVLDFLTGVFTGDWEKAWGGIKDFFGGIWDAIWGIIKSVINLIIDGLNTLWRAIYRVFSGIANGVGKAVGWIGKLFKQDWEFKMPVNPPLIPKLAKGAVLPANKPFLAQLGDQKNGRNLEAPESLLREIYSEQNAPIVNLLSQMLVEIKKGHVIKANNREIARSVREGEASMGTNITTGSFANAY